MQRVVVALCLLSVAACDEACWNILPADAGPDIPDVVQSCDVERLLFNVRCIACHGENDQWPYLGDAAGTVGLESNDGQDTIVVAGDLLGSLLWRKITGTQARDEGVRMPPGVELDATSIAIVRRWIETGAEPCPAPDAGFPFDAGFAADAGADVDAGPVTDAGLDGGA